jgi:parallel beta-helix repeat protein
MSLAHFKNGLQALHPHGGFNVTEKISRANVVLAIVCLSCLASVGCAGISAAKGTPKTVSPATFSLSGTISPATNGTGVTVTLSGAARATTTTDNSGNYSFNGLQGGSYTVAATKNTFNFSPARKSLTLSTADLTGVNFAITKGSTPNVLSISGRISPAADGMATTVTLSGTSSAITSTDNVGSYSFTGLGSGEYTVTPRKNGFQFSPGSQRTTLSAVSFTGVNFTASKDGSTTFSITGTINPAGNGSGVTVTLSGSGAATAVTDSLGNFSFTGLPNGTYNVTPIKNGFTFSPSSQRATVSAADVSGVLFRASKSGSTTYSITGTITPAGNAGGATVILSGAAGASTVTDSRGNYSFTDLPSGSYTVTPSKNAFKFSPSSQSATIGAKNVTGVNFLASKSATNTVNIYPGQDIPSVVKASPPSTTFLIYPGTYRLTEPIIPKNGNSFIGQTACAPPAVACTAIISGSRVIGPNAVFDGRNYKVVDQTQRNAMAGSPVCDAGWSRCVYPEDVYFDGVPLRHLSSSTLPAIGPGQWWFDYVNHVIYFHDNPARHKVETSIVNNAFGGSANNVTIQYLTVEEFASMYPTGSIGECQAVSALTQGINWIVANNEVRLNHGFGVRVNYRVQILNNYIHDNGQLGIGGGIGDPAVPSTESIDSGVLVQGNVINHNDYAHFNPGFGSGGFKIGSTSGIVLRGNTIQHNEGSGIHFDAYSQNEVVDGNTITDNSDADGLVQEIGYGSSTFRNNIVLRNGAHLNGSGSAYQIAVHASSNVNAYCNVMEVPNGASINGWTVAATDRGYSNYPPSQYLVSSGNSFHHNTVIWDPGASGIVGFYQNDIANQPNFFADNTPPDYNAYHLSSATAAPFVYDDNNSRSNKRKTFPSYQSTRGDVHGTVDTNNTSAFPQVSITSPADQSSVGNAVTVAANARDASGISRVEFYVDWKLQATVTSSPYNFNWANGVAGSHTIAAMAYSNAGISSCYAVTLTKQ